MKQKFLLLLVYLAAGIAALAADPNAFQLHSVADAASATTKEYSHQLRDGKKEALHLETSVLLDGSAIKSATVQQGQNGRSEVLVTFTEEGRKTFGEVTSKHVGKRLAMIVDGKILAAPNVNEPILGGSAVITGTFTAEEAAELAKRLNGSERK